MSAETIQSIIPIITLAGTVFAVYFYFRKPQEQSEKTDIVIGKEIEYLKLSLTNLKDNHIHTLENDIKSLQTAVQNVKLSVERLSTIIEERIPRK